MPVSNSLLLPGISVAVSLLVFSRLYRVSLLWFVRGRLLPLWTQRAEIMGLLASLPLALAIGFLWGGLTQWLLTLFSQLVPGTVPDQVLAGFTRLQPWLAALAALLYLAYTVPQLIANSKVFAIRTGSLKKPQKNSP